MTLGIRTIEGSFAECSELETVTIPAGVNKISRSTFAGCTSLRDVWIYSDNVELDYISDNTKKDGCLFVGCPDLTIHNISFDALPDSGSPNDEREVVRFRASKRVYSDEQLISMITPKPNDNKYHYWGQFQYALGYGFTEMAAKCIDAYEAAGNEDDKIWANSARLFMSQAGELGIRQVRL